MLILALIYMHTVYGRAAKASASTWTCADLPALSLLNDAVSSEISL